MDLTNVETQYVRYLRQHRDLASGSITLILRHVRALIRYLADRRLSLASVDGSTVQDFVVLHFTGRSRTDRRGASYALRDFLKYGSLHGIVRDAAADAIPTVRRYTNDSMPRALPWTAVEAVLNAIPRTTFLGLRDYAVVLLLASYGLRIGEVLRLDMKAIDWPGCALRVRQSKRLGSIALPLLDDVGTALEQYVRARAHLAKADCRQLFVQARPPHRPLSHVGDVIRLNLRAYARFAGVPESIVFPHAFRHAMASRMLQRGHAMKTIAEVLGHRSLRSTSLYAKLDETRLAAVALELP